MNIRDKLKILDLSDVSPYANNAKKHSPEQIEQLKKSFTEYGYYQPICVDENNTVVVGHGRYFALKEQDPGQKIEVVDLSNLSSKQIKKLRILDNKIISSEWDNGLLQAEISSLYSDLSDVDSIINDLALTQKEMSEMFDHGAIETDISDSIISSYEIIVECNDESDLESVYNKLIGEGLKCRISTL